VASAAVSIRSDGGALAALSLALLVWASSFPATRIALAAHAPGHLALARYCLATLVLLACCMLGRAPLPRRSDLPALALTGLLCGTLYQLGFNYGMRTVSSGPAAAPAPAPANWALLYLALFPGALSFTLWSYALARLPVAQASSALYLVPVFAFPIAWLWLGELPGALSFIGGAVTLIGVLLVQLKGR